MTANVSGRVDAGAAYNLAVRPSEYDGMTYDSTLQHSCM